METGDAAPLGLYFTFRPITIDMPLLTELALPPFIRRLCTVSASAMLCVFLLAGCTRESAAPTKERRAEAIGLLRVEAPQIILETVHPATLTRFVKFRTRDGPEPPWWPVIRTARRTCLWRTWRQGRSAL